MVSRSWKPAMNTAGFLFQSEVEVFLFLFDCLYNPLLSKKRACNFVFPLQHVVEWMNVVKMIKMIQRE